MWLSGNSNSKIEGTYKRKLCKVYPGQFCDYSATKASHLKTHVENKHVMVRYPCNYSIWSGEGNAKLDIKRQVKPKT